MERNKSIRKTKAAFSPGLWQPGLSKNIHGSPPRSWWVWGSRSEGRHRLSKDYMMHDFCNSDKSNQGQCGNSDAGEVAREGLEEEGEGEGLRRRKNGEESLSSRW